MRVQPGDTPAAGFSWGDYEDVVGGDNAGGEFDGDGGADADGEDDGWGVVKRGGRSSKSCFKFERLVTDLVNQKTRPLFPNQVFRQAGPLPHRRQ